ncbi:DUF4864 domain-containing protein [Tardiphaga sp. 709]|uniref:DUF4864 domain-containing protein n=1 Tax=Tardiphaga sp. 709 TaxID=3076039 RepID=UPI0028E88F5F|nr:DUF4864 domain-containing protein [Tardiphaga sp. 709]WNV08885.1 DUF4864 domain-containing protein [Tardiphaga sp. 709]
MRSLLFLVVIVIGLASPVRAADHVAAAQKIIRSQADALVRDDAVTAYGFAAPDIQSIFTDPDSFMDMVRNAYAPIYRHRSFEFTESNMSSGIIEQKVHIVDTDGVPWDALYTVEPQPDGSLKISGCMLLKVGQAV